MSKYVGKEDVSYPRLRLRLDGNPYAESESDRKNLAALFQLVNENRNSFFSLL